MKTEVEVVVIIKPSSRKNHIIRWNLKKLDKRTGSPERIGKGQWNSLYQGKNLCSKQ